MTMDPLEVRNYWEKRLEKAFGLHGVGYANLGLGFNRWMYRIRRAVFLREVGKHVRVTGDTKVLDIGCGTGFYIDRWKEMGVGDITGLDLTEVVVANCSKKYPEYKFVREDVGEKTLTAPLGTFDCISAFDVLFHIVDDQRFENAFRNIASLCKPGGIFVMSDNFLHGQCVCVGHQASRSLDEIEHVVMAAGFDIVERRPMFFLMNDPIDSNNPLFKLFWTALMLAVSLHNVAGSAIGGVLYPLELLLTRVVKEGPSTEILICKKRGPQNGKPGTR
jgi:SAM-dependent methyltransferase